MQNLEYILKYLPSQHPSIAQLAERETVEAKQLSLGHWFESGWTETFLYDFYGHHLFPTLIHVSFQTVL